MTREEATMIVDRIQTHRQYFIVTNSTYKEWGSVLEDYDFLDVNGKLTEFLQNGDNYGKTPEVYQLIKNLKPIEEKLKNNVLYINCPKCFELVENDNFNKHFDRCSSVTYIIDNYKKYYSKNLERKKLMELDEKKFYELYWKFNKTLLEKLPDGEAKESLAKTLKIFELQEEKND